MYHRQNRASTSSMSSTRSTLRQQEIFHQLMLSTNNLQKNWKVDIANLLDEYMAELELGQTSDEDIIHLNFGEAALVLQNSAVIYTKKVQCFEKCVLDMHKSLSYEFLLRKKEREKRKAEEEAREQIKKQKVEEQKTDNEQVNVVHEETAPSTSNQKSKEPKPETPKNEPKNKIVLLEPKVVLTPLPEVIQQNDNPNTVYEFLTDLFKKISSKIIDRNSDENFYSKLPLFSNGIDQHLKEKCFKLLANCLSDVKKPLLKCLKEFLTTDEELNIQNNNILSEFESKKFLAAKMMLLTKIRNTISFQNMEEAPAKILEYVNKFMNSNEGNRLKSLNSASVLDTPRSVFASHECLDSDCNHDSASCEISEQRKMLYIGAVTESEHLQDASNELSLISSEHPANASEHLSNSEEHSQNASDHPPNSGENPQNANESPPNSSEQVQNSSELSSSTSEPVTSENQQNISEQLPNIGEHSPIAGEQLPNINGSNCDNQNENANGNACDALKNDHVYLNSCFLTPQRELRISLERLPLSELNCSTPLNRNSESDLLRKNGSLKLNIFKLPERIVYKASIFKLSSDIIMEEKLKRKAEIEKKCCRKRLKFEESFKSRTCSLVDFENFFCDQISGTKKQENHDDPTSIVDIQQCEEMSSDDSVLRSETIGSSQGQLELSEIERLNVSTIDGGDSSFGDSIVEVIVSNEGEILSLSTVDKIDSQSESGIGSMRTSQSEYALSELADYDLDFSSKQNESINGDGRASCPPPLTPSSTLQNMDYDIHSDNFFDTDFETSKMDTLSSADINSTLEGDFLNKIAEEFKKQKEKEKEQLEMQKRVEEWHKAIEPQLKDAQMRSHFDIHEYGKRILEACPNTQSTVCFEDIVVGQPRKEIARYFLASLQLANDYNVEIIHADPNPLAVNCMELRKLSTVQNNEVRIDFNDSKDAFNERNEDDSHSYIQVRPLTDLLDNSEQESCPSTDVQHQSGSYYSNMECL